MCKMLMSLLNLIFVLIESESAKILGVFPTPSISHQIVFRPLMLELARRGHEVTVITTDPAYPKGQAPNNLTEIDVHNVSYEYWKIFGVKGNEEDQIEFFRFAIDLLLNLVVKQLKSPGIQKLFRDNKTFDLVFIESCIRPAIVYSYVYNAPVIEISSLSGIFFTYEAIGAASHPLIYPNALHRRVYDLALWEKIQILYVHYSIMYIATKYAETENKVMRSILGSDMPNLQDLWQNVRMMFLNIHPIWDFNRPVPSNVLYLGSLRQYSKHELPEDLKLYLDSSENGIIYVSFGTNVKPSMLPPDKLKIFTDVFSQLSYNVLWKWDNDELPERPNNVKISKWFPQSDLLRHPNIKLFITQCGLQSTEEALAAGVPLIGIPILADQWFNAEQFVKLNIGKKLLIETLTKTQLMDAIDTVINDKSYRNNAVKLHDFMNDQPEPPLERAVWWTEHVLRHGEVEYRRTPGAKMQWTEYYELNIVFLLLGTLVAILSATVLVLRFTISNVKYYIHIIRFKVKEL